MASSSRRINLHAIAHRALLNYGFNPEFPKNVVKEAKALKDQLKDGISDKSIEDLRSLLWSSIDNFDSEDLDQLEFCQRSPRGEIQVFVAIADVDAYVVKGTAMDKRAYQNGATVYAEVETFTMIPEKLCTNLSSLLEGCDRLAIVIDFFVGRDGELRHGQIRRAVVHNKAKLVYESVGDWLENRGSMPEKIGQIKNLKEQILLQSEAAQRLHDFRMNNGALELDTREPGVVMKKGEIEDITVKKRNLARTIIENFMIAANRTMTGFFEKNRIPYVQRILPTPERWSRIIEVAQEHYDDLPLRADAKALSDFLVRQRDRDPDHFPDLSLAIVKLLGYAIYDLVEPGRKTPGHFGLAVRDYTHSTAPNRRYVDVILQRLIKAALAGKNTPYTKIELKEIADWCSDRDRASKKVERFMVKVAGAILLMDKVNQIFEGIITGASEKGTYVRIFTPPVEGRVVRNFRGMNIGDKVRVRLVRLDPWQGYVDFDGIER
ncbi:MAG TPA: RNB domain-containing ribonuclease [Candidatus Omnitrophota bacterium]|nr:RNB domain-containing ribonuclease [Candidatus Omnitrophota bacterium]HPD84981.1 RNB domain-containing ribonuclease [Candidatus Omnitrophota bacterium]HRZ03839.1 RNB domain-containing ribonuclease [Candidatus Omnitrophota bacterium]